MPVDIQQLSPALNTVLPPLDLFLRWQRYYPIVGCPNPGPWQCVLFLISRSFHDGGALNYSTAPHRSKTTLISNGVFCLLESKILSIGQTLLYSLAQTFIYDLAPHYKTDPTETVSLCFGYRVFEPIDTVSTD
jgi:hypothetical protein